MLAGADSGQNNRVRLGTLGIEDAPSFLVCCSPAQIQTQAGTEFNDCSRFNGERQGLSGAVRDCYILLPYQVGDTKVVPGYVLKNVRPITSIACWPLSENVLSEQCA